MRQDRAWAKVNVRLLYFGVGYSLLGSSLGCVVVAGFKRAD